MDKKIKNMYVGLAVGDAMGYPFEFHPKDLATFTGKLDRQTKQNNRFHGPKMSAIGQVTDDTEMTIALHKSIMKSGRYNKESAIEAYMEFTTFCSFLGNNTRAIFKGIKTIRGFEARHAKLYAGKAGENSQGIGCLMRAAPLVFCYDSDVIKDCSLTNPNSISISCVRVYVAILKMILKEKLSKERVLKFIEAHNIDPLVKDVCVQAMEDETFNRNVVEKKGWVVHGLYCGVFAAFFGFVSYQEGIELIIRQGGDTDTNGCIAGAVLGARFPVPKEHLEVLLNFQPNDDYPRTEEQTFRFFYRNYL